MSVLERILVGVVAALVSASVVWSVLKDRTPHGRAMAELKGYDAGPGRDPAPGDFAAVGVYTQSKGYAHTHVGKRIDRLWTIEKTCVSGRCAYMLTRRQQQLPPQTAPLVRRRDGWHATFPLQTLTCGTAPDGTPILWQQEDRLILRFSDEGRAGEGRASKYSHHPDCGYGVSTAEWHITAVGR